MPILIAGGSSGAAAGVGVEASSPLHVTQKPLPYGSLGHYRVNHRCVLVASQAANSRLFEVRNTHASNLIVPTRLVIKWMQTGAATAFEDSLDVYKCTGFSAPDTTNVVTPVPSQKRASMAASPGAAQIRGVTVAGASAGMTGGTLTKDSSSIGQLPQWFLAAQPTAGTVGVQLLDVFDDVNGTHPFVFVQNEGFEIENRAVAGATHNSVVYIDFSWAEVSAF